MFRRKNRGGSSQPLQRESDKGIQKHGDTASNKQNSNDAQRRNVQQRSLHAPSGDQPWHKHSHRARRDQKEQQRSGNGSRPSHRAFRGRAAWATRLLIEMKLRLTI